VGVIEVDLQREGLLAAFADAYFELDGFDADGDGPEWLLALVDQHLDLARSHPVGELVSLGDGPPMVASLPLSA
jgi:sugar lactone lactonase YvrE